MDALGQFVRTLTPSGSIDLRCRFAGLWQVPHDPAPSGQLPYHVVLDGQAVIEHAGGRLAVADGDVVIFPRGAAHTVRSPLPGEALRVSAIGSRRFNGVVTEVSTPAGAAPLDLLCGTIHVGAAAGVLLSGLSEVLLVRTAKRADCAGLAALIAILRFETESPSMGSVLLIDELSTALFVLLLRALLADGAMATGAMSLLTHPRLAPAIEAMLSEYAQDWTIASLASRCHLARATFAKQFAEVGRLTPMEFLTSVRLQRAATLLAKTTLPIDVVAERCGYRSTAAFSRLFKRLHGEAPGQYRRERQLRRDRTDDQSQRP